MSNKRIPLILLAFLSLGVFACQSNQETSQSTTSSETSSQAVSESSISSEEQSSEGSSSESSFSDSSLEESSEQSEESSSEEISSEESLSSSEESKTYEKDAEGFYILEDDYFSYHEDASDKRKRNKVHIPTLVEEQPTYSQMRLYIGDKQVPVYNVKTNFSQIWNPEAPNRINNAVASIGLEGKVTFKLQLNFNSEKHIVVRPTSKQVPYTYDVNRRVITFEISSEGQYVVELTNDRVLHLFVNKMEAYTNPFTDAIVFKRGIHNKNNDSRINSNNEIRLYSGQKVYIEDGAFIQGRFAASNASNIQIVGPGYIDGAVFERNATTGKVLVPIDFNYCSNITFKDFAVIDPAGWCFNMYFCNDFEINNCKVISSRSNGDGISIQSCNRANIKNCFVRSWDDSLVVKNYPRWDNRSIEGSTNDITFDNCVLWTDLAQSMEVGFECVGVTMNNIVFQNITVLHNFHKPVFSIHNGNNANINGVHFKNITVEDASMGKGDGKNTLVELTVLYSSTWSDQHKVTALGKVDNVELNNILVLDGKASPEVKVSGCIDPRSGYGKDPHYVNNVEFTDFLLYGNNLNRNYSIYVEEYAQNVTFKTTGKDITGHTFIVEDVSSYGSNIDFSY